MAGSRCCVLLAIVVSALGAACGDAPGANVATPAPSTAAMNSPQAMSSSPPPKVSTPSSAGASGGAGPALPAVMSPPAVPPSNMGDPPPAPAQGAAGAASTADQPIVDAYAPWEPSCPDGFTPKSGANTGFMSDAIGRDFAVYLPGNTSAPSPVFLALTGTVQTEPQFLMQSGLGDLTNMGFIVLVPSRLCSTRGTSCNGWGDNLSKDGRLWEPWFDASNEDRFRQDAGPDVRFYEAMVKCVGKAWPVDAKRIYLGGVSAGGTITNRNMTFNSGFFAGGVNSSGVWFSVTGSIRPQAADQVEDKREGWCCPRPLHSMDSSIVINIYGGSRDTWSNPNAMPGVNVDFGPETQLAASYYAAQSKVLTISCTGNQGHTWPASATPWLASTLLSFPKGSDPASFKLTTQPPQLTCKVGPY